MSNVTTKDNVSEETDIESSRLPQKSLLRLISNIVYVPFLIIFYPIIWVFREFGRLWRFLLKKESDKHPLDFEEIAFVESVPVFLLMTTVIISIILGLIGWIGFSERVNTFFRNLTNGLDGIVQIIKDFWGAIIWFLTAIYDLIYFILNEIYKIYTNISLDPIIVLIIAVVFVAILLFVWVVISELGIMAKVYRRLGIVGLGLSDLPRAFYYYLDVLWVRLFLRKFGRFVSGGTGTVTIKNRSFFRRIIILVIFYAIWVLIWGISLIADKMLDPTYSQQLETNPDILVADVLTLIIVLILSGFLAGTVLMFVLVRILNIIAKDKYSLDQKAIDDTRHQSLLDYILPKGNFPAINLSTVSRILDIPKNDFNRHFNDKKLSDWVLTTESIINYKLYSERMDYVEDLVDEGLENEDTKHLIKAVDYLAYMEKGLQNDKEYLEKIKLKKEIIYEDIADLRGELDDFKGNKAQSNSGA